MNSPAGNGFFANLKATLPFGSSNVSNPTIPGPGSTNQQQQQQNPNFPSNKQLDPKNTNGQIDPNSHTTDPTNDPNHNADPNKGQGGSSLDNFKDVFKLPVGEDGKPVQHVNPLDQPIFNIDPKQLNAVASKMNFTAGIPQETLQKAMSGQDPQAFMDVLNTVARNGFSGATQALTGMMETALQTNNQRFESALPERIRNTQIGQQAPKHPALNHPAAIPLVNAMKMQIAATNPHLSPEKVVEQAENYVIALSTDVNTHDQQQQVQARQKSNPEPDWFGQLTQG